MAQRLRRGESAVHDAGAAHQSHGAAAQPLRPGRVASIILQRGEDRSAEAHQIVAAVAAACPEAAGAFALCEQFLQLLRERQPEDLEGWLTEVAACTIPGLERFAAGVKRDLAAVQAALTLPYSNGQTEGQITRLKLIKRSMYGRAKLDLLEHRVLYRAIP